MLVIWVIAVKVIQSKLNSIDFLSIFTCWLRTLLNNKGGGHSILLHVGATEPLVNPIIISFQEHFHLNHLLYAL